MANSSLPFSNPNSQLDDFVFLDELLARFRTERANGMRCYCPHPDRLGDSVLEERFWHWVRKTSGKWHGSASQFHIGKYRVDTLFDCGGKMVVVELDGKAYHDQEADKERDSVIINSVDAIIRIPFAAVWHYPYATFAVLASWYPRFDIGQTLTCLPVSELRTEIEAIADNDAYCSLNDWLAEVDPSYDVWECGDTYATVGSPKGFLYTMNRHVITRQFGSSSPMLRERLYKVANCDPNAKLSQHEITVSCKS